MDEMIGRVLKDRYEILEKMGEQPYYYRELARGVLWLDENHNVKIFPSTKYKAWDKLKNETVVVRMIPSEVSGLPIEWYTGDFLTYHKDIQKCTHVNLCCVRDTGKEGDILYCVMEYVDGMPLKEYIKQSKRIPWQEAVDYLLCLLDMRLHPHFNGNFYPHNVMVCKNRTIKVENEIFWYTCNTSCSETDSQFWYSVSSVLYEMLMGEELDLYTAWEIYLLGWKKVGWNTKEPDKTEIPEGLKQVLRRMIRRIFGGVYLMEEEIPRIIQAIKQLKKSPKLYKGRELKIDIDYYDEISRAAFDIKKDRETITQLKANLTSCEQEKDSLDAQNKALTEENEGLKKAKHALSDKNKLLYDGIKKLQSDNQTLQSENTALQTELQSLHAEIEGFTADNRTFQAVTQKLQSEIEMLTAENKKIQTQNQKLLTEKCNLAGKVEELETTIKQMRESRPVQVMTFFPLNDEEKASLLEQHQ